jgi:type IV pilus assembly protein PilX
MKQAHSTVAHNAARGITTRRIGRRRAQRGLSLVTTLLFMVSALMLGVSVLSVNVMQERMIGNTKDRDLAFQAAEAALRDAEQDLKANITADSAFAADCANGLCTPPSQRAVPLSVPVHDAATGFAWSNDNQVRKYGQHTGARPFPGVRAGGQPRYVIEKLGPLGTPPGESLTRIGLEPAAPAYGYRITAQAGGAREETVVILQSIHTKR